MSSTTKSTIVQEFETAIAHMKSPDGKKELTKKIAEDATKPPPPSWYLTLDEVERLGL